jgi:hypothetical protein
MEAKMIARKPWDYGVDIKNRDYLKQDESFDSIIQELAAALAMVEQTAVRFCIEPKDGLFSGDDLLLRRLQCRRPSWHILLDLTLLDKYFNGRMGIRAQYYHSPYRGHLMTHRLLSALKNRLVDVALAAQLPSVCKEFLELSLTQPSAKAWISERWFSGEKIIDPSDSTLSEEELQNDWLDVARAVKSGAVGSEYYHVCSAALDGVRAPLADQLEIKGAWITSEDCCEYVTPDKRDRDCQLFMFGFT